ncbi:MAG: hypothetical protein ABI670_13820 [Chloroflexota bacterium]
MEPDNSSLATEQHTNDERRRPAPSIFRRSSLLFAANILVIFVLAMSLRLAYWQDARAYAVGADEPDYVIPAQTLAREGRYVDTYISHNRVWTRVPLTSIFFAMSFPFVSDPAAANAEGDDAALMEPRYDALNIAQIIASLVTIALTMLLAARCFLRKAAGAALAAGYISALYPPLASSPAQRALSEPLSIMLIFAALYALSWWKPQGSWRSMLGVAALTGLLLGIASLARSVGIAMLPFTWLWFVIVYIAARRQNATHAETGTFPRLRFAPLQWARSNIRPLVCSAVVTLACLLAIAPWTYYNYRQYGSFLLLETANTTAYWHYHNFRHEDEDAILRQYSDPADRLAVIVREGTSNILEYPDQAIGASIFAFFYAWHLESNSAVLMNPWDMSQRDPDVPDLLHSDVAFLLLSLTGMAGLAGVGLRRPVGLAGRTLLVITLWLLVMLLLGIVVPYDARYRLPSAPALIVMAAGLLVLTDWRSVFSPRRAWAILRSHAKVAAVTAVLLLWVLIGAYTPNIPPLLRSLYQSWRGDLVAPSVDSFGRYMLAEQAFPTFYWPYRHHADALRAAGRDEDARALYTESWGYNPDDPYGILGFADLAARNPDWELTPDESTWLKRDEADWRGNPWNSFQPTATSTVDVGTGRDIGYILGFHLPDRAGTPSFDYRWSRGRSTVRIPVPAGQTYNAVTLRMSAPGIGPPAPMQVTVSIDGAKPTNLEVPSGWADYTVDLPATLQSGKTVTITITSPTRSPVQFNPTSNDTRNLGVGLDSVTFTQK